MEFEKDKVIPQDIELEEVVLGSLMTDTNTLKKVAHILKPEVFYKLDNQSIVKAIIELHNEDKPIDIATVAYKLKTMGKLFKIGGPIQLSKIAQKITSSCNVEYHLRILWQLYIQRELIDISRDIEDRSFKGQEDVFNLLDDALQKFENLDVTKKETVIKKLSEQLISVLESTEEDIKQYFSGYDLFDKKLRYGPNNITLLGGKSGTGKTRMVIAWMIGLLMHQEDISILWCNMEDDTPKMIRCFLSYLTGMDNDELLNKKGYSEKDKADILLAKETINKWDIEFIDQSKKISEIKSIFKYFCQQRQGRFCILIIDNVMLLKDNNNFKMNQTSIDDLICRNIQEIKELANKIGKASVLMLHHFNDEQMNKLNLKDGYRPRENHFKGSTRYRDISTQVILINKPEEYPDLLAQYKYIKDVMKDLFITEITKNRNSKKGIIRWFCKLGILKFQEINND